MLRQRVIPLPSFFTALVLASCGGRMNGEPPVDQNSETTDPASTGSEPGQSSTSGVEPSVGSEPPTSTTVVASTTDTTIPPSTTTITPPDDPTTTSVEMDGGVVTSPPVVIDPPPPVCPDQCGNDVIDACEVCNEGPWFGVDPVEPGLPMQDLAAPPLEPMCTTITEQCDGALGVEQTCEAIGFSGGTLSCGQTCRYDDAQCQSCLTGTEVQACRDDLAAGVKPSYVALATNTVELAAAWNEGCEAKVAWFDTSLTTLRTTALEGAPCITATGGISLAPLANTWVAELGTRQYVLGPDGGVLSERDIDGTALFVAPRVDAPPLVVRQTSYRVVTASLLDETGAEVWTHELSDSVTEAHYGSAAAVSDGFLVALRTDAGVQVFHLSQSTGSILDVSTPGTANTEYPQLNAANGEVRLVWADFGGTPNVRWAKLDERGRRAGDAVEIGASPDYFNRSPIVVDGSDTIVVFGGYTGTTGVGHATHIRRIDASGSTTLGDIAVQSDPNRVSWPQVVRFDGAFVTAWVGNGEAGRVGLAKVNP